MLCIYFNSATFGMCRWPAKIAFSFSLGTAAFYGEVKSKPDESQLQISFIMLILICVVNTATWLIAILLCVCYSL